MIRSAGPLTFAITFLLTLALIARVGLQENKQDLLTLPVAQIFNFSSLTTTSSLDTAYEN